MCTKVAGISTRMGQFWEEGRFNVHSVWNVKCMEAMSLETLLEAAKYVEYTTQAKARGKSLITDYF